jgi:transmembrane sensor
MREDRQIMESAALDWIIRLRDPDFDDWEAFHGWLAADPAHAEAYHRLAAAEEDMTELLAAAPPPEPRRRSWRVWLRGAIAASLVAMIAFHIHQGTDTYLVDTPAGVRRTVALPDGSQISLNGDTRLWLNRVDHRYANVERGEAAFNIVANSQAPFMVQIGDATLVDTGTRFNVRRRGKITAVEVAEGTVVFNPRSSAVRLDAGRTLRAIDGDGLLALGHVARHAVAGWKDGRLFYHGQTMEEVADDLARWSGQAVTVDPRVADQRFSGVLRLAEGEDMVRLAPLLDVDVRRSGQQWVLAPRT